jgi:hypothetical protein
MQASNVNFGLGQALRVGNAIVADPGTGNIIDLGGRNYAVGKGWGAGTYKLPNLDVGSIGTVFTAICDAAQTYTSQAGTSLATGVAGGIITFQFTDSNTWRVLSFTTGSLAGFIPLDQAGWREISSNDIINATGNGGVLATDTTPTYETINGDTDGCLRILWAASNADPIARQITLPPDLDRTADIQIKLLCQMSGGDDQPVIDIDSFFDVGDTKVEDATNALGSTLDYFTATIAAADIPATARTLSIELTPGAHTTDTLALYGGYIAYTKKAVAN